MSEASRNDTDISVGLCVDTSPDFNCDVALVGIPHQHPASKFERAPHALHPILRQVIHPPVPTKSVRQ